MTTPEPGGIFDDRVLVIAEHRAIADLWVQLNAPALQTERQTVRIVTAADEHTLRGLNVHRLIILGRPDEDVEDIARICCRLTPSQVIKMQHTDRLAAGWRTA